jgi:hypothetical protein
MLRHSLLPKLNNYDINKNTTEEKSIEEKKKHRFQKAYLYISAVLMQNVVELISYLHHKPYGS